MRATNDQSESPETEQTRRSSRSRRERDRYSPSKEQTECEDDQDPVYNSSMVAAAKKPDIDGRVTMNVSESVLQVSLCSSPVEESARAKRSRRSESRKEEEDSTVTRLNVNNQEVTIDQLIEQHGADNLELLIEGFDTDTVSLGQFNVSELGGSSGVTAMFARVMAEMGAQSTLAVTDLDIAQQPIAQLPTDATLTHTHKRKAADRKGIRHKNLKRKRSLRSSSRTQQTVDAAAAGDSKLDVSDRDPVSPRVTPKSAHSQSTRQLRAKGAPQVPSDDKGTAPQAKEEEEIVVTSETDKRTKENESNEDSGQESAGDRHSEASLSPQGDSTPVTQTQTGSPQPQQQVVQAPNQIKMLLMHVSACEKLLAEHSLAVPFGKALVRQQSNTSDSVDGVTVEGTVDGVTVDGQGVRALTAQNTALARENAELREANAAMAMTRAQYKQHKREMQWLSGQQTSYKQLCSVKEQMEQEFVLFAHQMDTFLLRASKAKTFDESLVSEQTRRVAAVRKRMVELSEAVSMPSTPSVPSTPPNTSATCTTDVSVPNATCTVLDTSATTTSTNTSSNTSADALLHIGMGVFTTAAPTSALGDIPHLTKAPSGDEMEPSAVRAVSVNHNQSASSTTMTSPNIIRQSVQMGIRRRQYEMSVVAEQRKREQLRQLELYRHSRLNQQIQQQSAPVSVPMSILSGHQQHQKYQLPASVTMPLTVNRHSSSTALPVPVWHQQATRNISEPSVQGAGHGRAPVHSQWCSVCRQHHQYASVDDMRRGKHTCEMQRRQQIVSAEVRNRVQTQQVEGVGTSDQPILL